jgi:trehalose/maltose transport system substrate-binding protein
MLVRFLASPEEQASRRSGEPPTIPALYKNADVLAANPYFSRFLQMREGVALRPSVPAGKMYPEVSRAYFTAVHAVISQKQSAAQAASDLQVQLMTLLKPPASTDANTLRPETAVASRR